MLLIYSASRWQTTSVEPEGEGLISMGESQDGPMSCWRSPCHILGIFAACNDNVPRPESLFGILKAIAGGHGVDAVPRLVSNSFTFLCSGSGFRIPAMMSLPRFALLG